MKVLICVSLLWVACGAYNYAATLYDFTAKFGYQRHLNIAVPMAIGGPFFTPVVVLSAEHPSRLLWKPLSVEQRWVLFHARCSNLERCYFEEHYGSGVPCAPPVNDLDLLHSLRATGGQQ